MYMYLHNRSQMNHIVNLDVVVSVSTSQTVRNEQFSIFERTQICCLGNEIPVVNFRIDTNPH